MRDFLIPIATRHGIPFFLGIITSKLDISGFISTKDLEDFSENPLMTISSHSVNHTDNSNLDELKETLEMCGSRETLMKLT
jgi:hypothetical protein